MSWLIVAISSYLFFAIAALFDKYLLSAGIPNPKVYSFYVGSLGILVILFIPFFGFSIPTLPVILISLLAGAVSILALYTFYSALKKFDASKIIPAIGCFLPILVFIFTLLSAQEYRKLSLQEIIALSLLIIGSVLVSKESSEGISLKSLPASFLAAFFGALSIFLSKQVFLSQTFISGIIWIRIGGLLSILFLLFSKEVRKEIFSSKKLSKLKTTKIFLLGQVFGAGAGLLQSWAVFLAPLAYVPFVAALQGFEYVFLFLIIVFLSFGFPEMIKEKMSKKIILQKTVAIILIAMGLAVLFIPAPTIKTDIASRMLDISDVPLVINWGVNFSQKHAGLLGLNWKETYLALLDDWKVKRIKVASYWDLIEKEENQYDFSDLDWQINEAEKRQAKILLVIGMKTPRWPECHIPEWAKGLKREDREKKTLELLEETVNHYQNSQTIWEWQVENEPFFFFGECPVENEEFVKQEVNLVKSLDPQKRPVLISDSGEYSSWFRPAKIGDIVGITMYRKAWFHEVGIYLNYPFPPAFYRIKAEIIKALFHKEVICVELQAEPWGTKLLYDTPLEEQEKLFTMEELKKNIEFAEKTGLDEFYLWGGEWMYWLKEKQNRPEFWNEVKRLFPI